MSAFLKSTLITNRDATPKVLTDPFIAGGNFTESYGWVFTGADGGGSTYKLCQVPSNSRISNLNYYNSSMGSGSVIDVGIWYPTVVPTGGGAFLAASLGGTLISSSIFSGALVLTNATTTAVNLVSTANTFNGPNYLEMPMWQMIGLTADPECMFDLGFTVRVAVATAGYLGLKATYMF